VVKSGQVFGLVDFAMRISPGNYLVEASAQNTLVQEYLEADLRKVLDSNPSLGVAFYSAVCLQVCVQFNIPLMTAHVFKVHDCTHAGTYTYYDIM